MGKKTDHDELSRFLIGDEPIDSDAFVALTESKIGAALVRRRARSGDDDCDGKLILSLSLSLSLLPYLSLYRHFPCGVKRTTISISQNPSTSPSTASPST